MAFLNWLKPNRARTASTPAPNAIATDPLPGEAASPQPAEATISLQLRPILKMLPLDLEEPTLRPIVDSDTKIALPLKLIQPQLSSGRVVVKAATLLEAMPEHIRTTLSEIDSSTKVPIPLEEIFR